MKDVSLIANSVLLLVALACTVLLVRRSIGISREFQNSWWNVIGGLLCVDMGLSLNVSRHFSWSYYSLVLGATDTNVILRTLFYVLCILLVFNGVRQWYPLILSVQRTGVRQARLYRKLVEEANSIFLRWDHKGNIVSINRFGEELFGYSRRKLIGKPIVGTLVAVKDAEGHDMGQMIENIRKHPEKFRDNENENITRDGRRIWIAWRNAFISDGQGGNPELLSIGVDMTARKRVENAISALASSINISEARADRMGESMRHLASAYGAKYAFYATYDDEEKTTLRVLAMWDGERISSDLVYEIEGTPCQDVLSGNIDVIEKELIQHYPSDATLRDWGVESYFGTVLKNSSGEITGLISVMDIHPMLFPEWSRSVLHVFAERISGELERREAEESIYRLAHYDSLTGLPNRVLFHERLEQAIAHASRNNQYVALLFLDLDRFKHVNDSVGHAGGDILLKEVATRLKGCVRSSDTVARTGGDEFIVLLSDISTEKDLLTVTEKLACQLVDVISHPFYIDSLEFYVSVSIGITSFPIDGNNIDYLVRNADVAMYYAKNRGRNRYEYYQAHMNEITEKRSRMESELRVAVSREQLSLYYQPIVDVKAGKVLWFEALLRWQHPENGQVMPEDFIALAEETGLILPIGEWVIEEACRQLHVWHEQGLSIDTVAINLSMRQLERPGLADMLSKYTSEYKVRPSQLILEITESMLMEDPDTTLPIVQALSAKGYNLAMDDFGTGYSSFGQLRYLDVDSLKIDRSFVARLEDDSNTSSIVAAIIGMASELGMRVVAEGVENRVQMAFLKKQGCDLMQGFHLGHPMAASECENFIRAAKHPWHESVT
jgi:diguanylate cyclase (GGDEF)-like protein/PAS domain S-box-containing protein